MNQIKKAIYHLAKAVEKSQHTHAGRADDLEVVYEICEQPDDAPAAPAPKKKAPKKKAAKKKTAKS